MLQKPKTILLFILSPATVRHLTFLESVEKKDSTKEHAKLEGQTWGPLAFKVDTL